MTTHLAVPDWLAVVTLLGLLALVVAVLGLGLSLRRSRRHTEELLAAAATDAEALREQLAGLEQQVRTRTTAVETRERVPVAVVDDREYLITDLGKARGPKVPAPVVPAPQFADILLRESVIKTASLAAGLRRALSPEVRNRIRFEMKREVKRARKQRKLMLRAARRDWETRQRAATEVAS
ncbi:hypothetical protein L615_006100000120 [Nocardioides sp. J9]|uniref:hypothetical protein n=1 Tax=unclassified Nocardioides TaxID=2615069 RepID=UPI00048DA69B|nr:MULTISPECIES: hypothetical protein [unclassified Nocardioides]TWG93527.1 hypothetical protein L615_006100000120 [Nocardioides sp. J9]